MDVIGKLPRFAGASGRLFKRSDFLDGTLKAYFGPGQAPVGTNDLGTADAGGYRSPTDWNKEKTLLRAPQQVWLSSTSMANMLCLVGRSGGYYFLAPPLLPQTGNWVTNTSQNLYWANGEVSSSYQYFTGSPAPAPFTIVQNSGYSGGDPEGDRVASVYSDVKSQIESLRKGKTWVDVVRYPKGGILTHYNAYPTTNLGGRYASLVAPDPTENFFGTDFLHVFCGGHTTGKNPFGASVISSGNFTGPVPPYLGPAYLTESSIAGSGPEYFPYLIPNEYYPSISSLSTNADNITSDSGYLKCRAQVVGSYPKFAGYSVYLYSVNYVPSPYLVGTSFDLEEIPYGPQFDPFYYLGYLGFAQVDQTVPSLPIDLAAIAKDLAAYGYHYGGASEQLTSGNIVKLIADHYHFDPVTGKDLPVT